MMTDPIADMLTLITNAFAFVGLGRPERADLGSSLTHFLFVDTRDHNRGLVRAREANAFGRRVGDGMTEPKAQRDTRRGGLSLVPNANDLKSLREPISDSRHDVLNQGAGEAMKRTMLLLI